jgi:hypothetical protein
MGSKGGVCWFYGRCVCVGGGVGEETKSWPGLG